MITDFIGTTWSLAGTEYAAVEFTAGAVAMTRIDPRPTRLVDPRGGLSRLPLSLGVKR